MNDFQKEVLNIENTKRSIQSVGGHWNLPLGDVFFGVPESDYFGWRSFDRVPADTIGFNFYLGAASVSLLSAFTKSNFVYNVQRLSIGNSSFDLGSGMGLSDITNLLSEVEFPELAKFELGVWQLYDNSHCFYEYIGNVTRLLQRMPKIEHIALFGSFELDVRLSFPNLKYLSLKLDDPITCENGGYISQKTLDNVLSSTYPELRQLKLDLDCKRNDQEYTITELFTSGETVPNIEKIVITGGYKEGEIDRIMDSTLAGKKELDMRYIPRKY